jgi:hypothetical protein
MPQKKQKCSNPKTKRALAKQNPAIQFGLKKVPTKQKAKPMVRKVASLPHRRERIQTNQKNEDR